MVLHTGLAFAPLVWLDSKGVSATTTVFTNGKVLRCIKDFIGWWDCGRDCDGCNGCDASACDCDSDCPLLYSCKDDEYDLSHTASTS